MRFELLAAVAALLLSVPSDASTRIAHTPWEMHRPERVRLPSPATRHGAPETYRHAPPIPDPGPAWTELTGSFPGPLNPVDVHYLGPRSDYGSALRTCLTEADFTYFQTFVRLPAQARLDAATLVLGPVDDGARVVVFNGRFPSGVTPKDGVIEIGQSTECDLRDVLVAGDENRIVVQHLDDCAGQSWVHSVHLVLEGVTVGPQGRSWGGVKRRYR